MLLILFLSILPLLFYFIYKWSVQNFTVFEERGIPHKKPFPVIGNALSFVKNTTSLHKVMLNLYKETKAHQVYGYYNFRTPFFIINCPELIKKIAIKDFDSFANHQQFFGEKPAPIIKGMLTVMQDQRWKNMRNTITPVFTGAKMRIMFTLMNDCFAESIKYLHEKFEGNKGVCDVELKDCFCRLSNDLIATTAFGLKINSFEDKNNEFFAIGKSITQLKGRQALKFIMFSLFPKFFELLDVQFFDKTQTDYFVRLVLDAIKYREANNIVRPDMIQLLMEAKKESAHQWSDTDLVAQCFIFFFAAFENNANLICTTCYELVLNPEVQDKLYEEILDTQQALNGKTLDYDTLQKMKYMDMVLSESLRKWPLGALTDRECGKDYEVKDEDGNFICEFKKGDRIWIQIFGLQRDEEFFPNPDVFDPERFSDENKKNINPFTYMPFGVGPRICIGNRYALMQAKAMLYYLLLEFKLERSAKTPKNLLDEIRGFQIDVKCGFWFKLTNRQQ